MLGAGYYTGMIQSVCILGRQPGLGLAELESLYGAENISRIASQVAGISLATSEVNFARLGGSTRLARVIATVPNTLWKDVEKQLAKSVVELANELPEGKIQLGLSAFDIPITSAKLNATGLTLKKVLRSKTGRSVRVTPNPELELNTAQVLHNHLTAQTGIEFLVIAHGSETLIARTTDVQDIDSYTVRDRGRPKRDARVGMLPPKLAQIIINLAATTTTPSLDTVVLDPFCGTGVVLQEANIMGLSAYGTDLEPRMVEYSNTNSAWLDDTLQLPPSRTTCEVGDATMYAWQTMPVNLVASETYLGRAFTLAPSHDMLEQTSSDVNLILKKFLRNIHGQLQPGTRLCLAVPAWQTAPDIFRHLPMLDSLEEIGYNQVRFEHVRNSELLYYREGQIVARELLVLTRK